MSPLNSLVSVCIPAFRQPESLVRTIQSVLFQKSCSFEIIVTDDSEDASVQTAVRPFLQDRRLRYIKNNVRLGAVPNWNASTRYATGRVIKMLHHDDWLDGDTSLMAMTEPIFQGAAPFVFCACRQMSVAGHPLSIHRTTPAEIRELEDSPDTLAFGNFIGGPSVCAFDGTVGSREFDVRYTWLADAEFYMRLLNANNRRFVYIDEPLVNVTTDSATQISRFYESNRLSSVLENVQLFSSSKPSKCDRKRFGRHFTQLGFGLTAREIAVAARAALDDNGYRMALMLSAGYLRKVAGL